MKEKIKQDRVPDLHTETKESDLDGLLKYEMTAFNSTKRRDDLLNQAYNKFLTIRASSAECERAFSSGGRICNKFSNRHLDETMDEVIYLKSKFSNID